MKSIIDCFFQHTKSAVSQATVAAAPSTHTKHTVKRPNEGSTPINARNVASLQPLVFVPDTSNLVLPSNQDVESAYQGAIHKHLIDCDGWKVYGVTQTNNLPNIYLKLAKSRLTCKYTSNT